MPAQPMPAKLMPAKPLSAKPLPARPLPLQHAFDTWLAHQRVAGRLRRGSSEAVYRSMWQALVAWCVAQRPALHLADLQGTQLLRYLASRQGLQAADGVLTPRYQQRLASLVQRVQAHQVWLQQQADAAPLQALALATAAAPRRPAPLLAAAAMAATEPPLHLLPAQLQALQALLCAQTDASQGRWQTWRDRCAAALQLGAGLGPGDVRALRLADLRPANASSASSAAAAAGRPTRWLLQVAANGSAPAHPSPLADWAGTVLAHWLARRQAEALGGPWLLPSTRSGKPWGKVAQYEAGRRVLADAALDPDGGGSFRLRHSFALRQLQHGHAADTIAAWLGVIDPQVMLRYQQVAAGWPPGSPPPPAVAGAPAWPV